jgi:hypothetical protein
MSDEKTTGSTEKTRDIILAILMGVAAIATAFAAFRASLISDEVISNYNQGIRKVDEASQLWNEGNQFRAEDQAVFLEWMKAVQTDDIVFADYIQNNLMSADLLSGLEWWNEELDVSSPFVEENPNYQLVQFDQARKLDVAVDKHFKDAAKADKDSDYYEFVTVLLAVALFFLGIAGVAHSPTLQKRFMGAGGLLLVASLVFLGILLVP